MNRLSPKLLLFLYGFGFLVYAIFSFSLTAPNLLLSSWHPYVRFQTWMWQTFFNDRHLLAQTYLGIILLLFAVYALLVKKSLSWGSFLGQKKHLFGWLLIFLPLFFSNNALSYDVFNYIFNAKMVVYYQANPHVQTAVNFIYDDWTRFMHNVHTPAPYGYGWTLFSLLPYWLSQGKFLLAWLIFRSLSFLSLAALLCVYYLKQKTVKLNQPMFVAVVLNPLLVIEILSNSHNDLWMMVPAILSLLLISKSSNHKLRNIVISLFLLGFSISIKFATLLLLPLWGLMLISYLGRLKVSWLKFWPLFASGLMFMPLLIPRSKQFLPWYLTWSLVWLPLIPVYTKSATDKLSRFFFTLSRLWSRFVLMASFFALLRYLPYLWHGAYSPLVEHQQLLIVWVPILIGGMSLIVSSVLQPKQTSNQS